MAVSLTNEQVDRLHELADEDFEYTVSVETDQVAAEGAVKTLMASFVALVAEPVSSLMSQSQKPPEGCRFV